MCLTNCCRQTTKDRGFKFALFERLLNVLNTHIVQINLQLTHRNAIKINDNGQYFDFIGGTLSYVTYVMS